MFAASDAADETVAFLLSKGANPDLMDKNGQTAITLAIQTMCSSTIDLLAPVTQKGLGEALGNLAIWQRAFDTRSVRQGCLCNGSGTGC